MIGNDYSVLVLRGRNWELCHIPCFYFHQCWDRLHMLLQPSNKAGIHLPLCTECWKEALICWGVKRCCVRVHTGPPKARYISRNNITPFCSDLMTEKTTILKRHYWTFAIFSVLTAIMTSILHPKCTVSSTDSKKLSYVQVFVCLDLSLALFLVPPRLRL